ncbi:unnamed protein product [Mytilus edulis]|uniref:Uncharacterized protein n=1 Tax=Mytilus edulis TaxID=6550 RepID=A0A8S3PLZ0_MYTED|nr:unnamed protein product [Mytilus edulis]
MLAEPKRELSFNKIDCRKVESVDEQGELLAYKKTEPCQTDQTVINIMHLNEGEYERLEKNCRISYIKTLLASVVSRKPTNKRGNLFKIRGYKVFLSDRKVKIEGRKHFPLSIPPKPNPSDCLWIILNQKWKTKKQTLGNFYTRKMLKHYITTAQAEAKRKLNITWKLARKY